MIKRIAQIEYVRSAIEDKADLSEFKQKPSLRILFGVFLIAVSYVIAWPAISVLGAMSIYFEQPLLIVIGGPLLYGLSHLVFIAGMYFAGAKYSAIFARWAVRVSVEKLLRWTTRDQ